MPEILVMTPAIAQMVREGKTHQIPESNGMQLSVDPNARCMTRNKVEIGTALLDGKLEKRLDARGHQAASREEMPVPPVSASASNAGSVTWKMNSRLSTAFRNASFGSIEPA